MENAGVSGRILKSHDEDGIKVIGDFQLTSVGILEKKGTRIPVLGEIKISPNMPAEEQADDTQGRKN